MSDLERFLVDRLVAPDAFETESRRNYLDALRSFDPDATLTEELTLRLVGPSASGGLTFDIGDALFRPLQDTVSAAAHDEVPLELTGLSSGSTVLHVRPLVTQRDRVADVPVDSSVADGAVRRTMQLFAEVENEGDLVPFSDVLTSASKFVDVLRKHELDLDMTWAASGGEVRAVSLTSRGREYLARQSEVTTRTEYTFVSGRITELRMSGMAKVKTTVAKNSPAHEVHFEPEQLLLKHLSLGDQVNFRVARIVEVDRIGRELSERIEYVSDASDSRRLFED